MKKLNAIILLSAIFFLSSCLTTEFKEYRFKINSNGSGSGTIKYINIISQDDDEENVSFKDFGELTDSWLKGTSFEDENPGMTVTNKRIFEEGGVLCGEVTFTFEHVDSIGFFRFKDCNCAPLLYYFGPLSETFDNSNGTYLGENANKPFIQWNHGTKEVFFKTRVQDDISECRSLLSLYNVWKETQ